MELKFLLWLTTLGLLWVHCGGEPTHATFYTTIDAPACGYGPPRNWVSDAFAPDGSLLEPGTPFTTAVSQKLFQDGKGCGACYTVKCVSANRDWGPGPDGCYDNPVTVTVIDLCPYKGNEMWCGDDKVHFDMSVPAWKQIGKETRYGYVEADFKRVSCNPTRNRIALNLAVRVRDTSHEYWQSFCWYYSRGKGTYGSLSIYQEGVTDDWRSCNHDWGTCYSCQGWVDNDKPMSFRINNGEPNPMTLTMMDALDKGWLSQKGQIKMLNENFGGLTAGGNTVSRTSKPRQRRRRPHRPVNRAWRRMKGKGKGMHCKRGRNRNRPCKPTARGFRH